jgi:Cu(I)/Ag(I) efflux system periplasmic protein CusF
MAVLPRAFGCHDFVPMPARRISMIVRLYCPLVMGLLPVALIACMNSAPTGSAERDATVPLGIDLGGSGPVIASAQPELSAPATHAEAEVTSPRHSDMQMVHEGHNDAHGTGTVNSVDPAQHKVNLTHNPIPEIGWPTMTMEFPVKPSVDLKTIKPGSRVNFTIEKGQDGMYEIQAISPAAGGQ